MDSGPSIITNLVIILIILLLAVLFTLTEYSLVKVRPSSLRAMQEAREKPSPKISHALNMLDHLSEYLSTAQVGITLTSLILGWLGEDFIATLIINAEILPAALPTCGINSMFDFYVYPCGVYGLVLRTLLSINLSRCYWQSSVQ